MSSVSTIIANASVLGLTWKTKALLTLLTQTGFQREQIAKCVFLLSALEKAAVRARRLAHRRLVRLLRPYPRVMIVALLVRSF